MEGMKAQVIALNLRLPVELHQELKGVSSEEGRTLNGQIVYVLKQYLQKERTGTATALSK